MEDLSAVSSPQLSVLMERVVEDINYLYEEELSGVVVFPAK
jgi:hypothetical protein